MVHIVFLKNKRRLKGNIIEEKQEGVIIEVTEPEKLPRVSQNSIIKKWFIPFSNILYIGFIESD